MRTFLFGLILISFFSCDPAKKATATTTEDQSFTTIILVRHAEKDYGRNPDLTAEGKARANKLAAMLKNMGVSAIYSTDFARTRQTAEPLAAQTGLEINIYDHNELGIFAGKLKRQHSGETVLVVGHSNTTPAMASLLDPNNDYEKFLETNYTNLLIVDIAPSGETKVLELTF